jgi:uncharacterized integral membrane protein
MTDTRTDVVKETPGRSVGSAVRLIFVVLLLGGLVALALDNRQNVRVGWVLGDHDTPLALVLGAAAVAGAILGWLLLHWPRHDRHRSSY